MDTQERIAALMHRGIAAAKTGQKAEARRMFVRVTELDEGHINAWLWLSGVVTTTEERCICLENVLTLDPQNAVAQKGLRLLGQHLPPKKAPVAPTCPHCGVPLPPSGKLCPACHQWLLVTCPACGAFADVEEPQCPACDFALGNFREGYPYYLTLAKAYMQQRRLSHFEEMLAYVVTRIQEEAALDISKASTTLIACADLYKQAGMWEKAENVYQNIITFAPDQVMAYLHLGALYRQNGSLDMASTFSGDPGEFDLVITDQTMPNMTGKQLAGELLSIRPGIPIVLCTGFSEQISKREAEMMGISAFVMKPIIIHQMANKIREVLDKNNHK